MSKHRTQRTMRDRLLSGALCLALVLGLLPAGGLIRPARAASWADPYAQQLLEWGIMTPNLAGNLDSTITRAEFVAMCNRAFGYTRLGVNPFVDVYGGEWYADDIIIAYNAGYFTGTSADPERFTASPNDPLTREMAAVAVARNLMLQETVGESMGFTDSRELSDWSRGMIATAVAEGVITGYDDGSFRPETNITRGEVAALLVRLIGTPVNQQGSYEMGNVYGNVTIASSHVTLRNTTIVGNLYVTGGVDLGRVLLENVTVLGRIVISGGGVSDTAQSSVVLRNVAADEMLVDSIIDQFVTVSAYGYTDIPLTNVRTDAYLEDASEAGYGLARIELVGGPGAKFQLAGNIKEVVNKTPLSELQLVRGTARKITIDEYARGSQVLVDTGTLVEEMNLDVATWVYGEGDIRDLNIGAEGCEVDILPESVTIRPGITATVDGQVIGSVAASELSSEPRLLAGYPEVAGVAPTQAEGLFAASKPGVVYWAVSELGNGSVDVEDLITNPVYGGNIFAKQAGSINAANAKTEYGRQITSLVPGGSYYLSAVLVDGRGSRSPLKVISFTTPDNTVPAFVGDPYMSKETCEIAQVTATANKDCVLYWALLTEGAAAPTPQEFRSGSVGGNSGYGSVSVVKNVPISVKVNRSTLMEKTTFWLYLWLTDLDGVQSMATPFRLVVKTPDETPPIVAAPVQTGTYEKTAGVTFSINEAPSTLYWAVVAEGDESFISSSADLTSMRTKIRVENGEGAISFGNTAAKGANVETLFTISGLDTEKTKTNNYIMYYVAKDAAGNYSDRVGYIRIRTLDTKPPEVTQWFTSTVNNEPDGQPLADTDVNLDFTEQVKGGSEPSTENSGSTPVTFLDFYNQVLATAGNATTQQAAKDRLARELAAHITLHYQPRNGEDTKVKPKHVLEEEGADPSDTNWIIDWRNAVITMDNDGHVVINLPNGGAAPAIQLDSGATYYFEFTGVFDNAYKPNGLMGNNKSGNYTLEKFTTAYAKVELREQSGVKSVDSGDDRGKRLDICFDVIPRSTGKVPDSEYWDMIMWSNIWMIVDIYRQEISPEGTKDWEKVNKTPIEFTKTATVSESARGLTATIEGTYGKVPETLVEGCTYRYGIHILELNGDEEYDPNGVGSPITWGAEFTMRFSLIAGGSGEVEAVSESMTRTNPLYNSYVGSGKVSEIGTVASTSESILTIPKVFDDKRQPSFEENYPEIEPGSASVEIAIRLTRPGSAYIVVASEKDAAPSLGSAGSLAATYVPDQASGQGPYYKDGRHIAEGWELKDPVSGKTDFEPLTDAEKQAALDSLYREVGRSYIPENGKDRESHKQYISYVEYGDEPVTNYSYPRAGYVTDPDTWFAGGDDVHYLDKPLAYTGTTARVTITNLSPETEYYVYFVLEGSGVPGNTVECYRIRTAKAQAPSVTVSGNSGKAVMTPSDDCRMYVALVQYSELDDLFTSVQDGQTTTYLDQMLTRYDTGSTTGPSVFDKNASADVKSRVVNYIKSSNNSGNSDLVRVTLPDDDEEKDTKYPDGYVPGGKGAEWDFNNDMEVSKGSYVVLVMVKQPHAGDDGPDYGFGAFSGLRKRDSVPPNLVQTDKTMKDDIVLLSQTESDKTKSTKGSYYGTLSLMFDTDVFYLYNDDKYTLTYEAEDTGGKKAVLPLISGTAEVDTKNKSGDIYRTIDLYVKGISGTPYIMLFNPGFLCNSDGYPANVLVLTFDPALKAKDVYTSTSFTPDAVIGPGFRVTWTTR